MTFYRYEAIQYAEHDIDGELVSPKIPNPTIELKEYEDKQREKAEKV